jgi:hypothetical protein
MRAADAENEDHECPFEVCIAPFTWVNAGPYVYGTTPPWVLRLYVSDVTYGGEQHTLTVAIEAADQATLDAFRPDAERLIDSASVPVSRRPGPATDRCHACSSTCSRGVPERPSSGLHRAPDVPVGRARGSTHRSASRWAPRDLTGVCCSVPPAEPTEPVGLAAALGAHGDAVTSRLRP